MSDVTQETVLEAVGDYPRMPCESCSLAVVCDGSDCPKVDVFSIYDEESAAEAAKE